jgi:hypothetical protein
VRPRREKCRAPKFACTSGFFAEGKPMSLIEDET